MRRSFWRLLGQGPCLDLRAVLKEESQPGQAVGNKFEQYEIVHSVWVTAETVRAPLFKTYPTPNPTSENLDPWNRGFVSSLGTPLSPSPAARTHGSLAGGRIHRPSARTSPAGPRGAAAHFPREYSAPSVADGRESERTLFCWQPTKMGGTQMYVQNMSTVLPFI